MLDSSGTQLAPRDSHPIHTDPPGHSMTPGMGVIVIESVLSYACPKQQRYWRYLGVEHPEVLAGLSRIWIQ